MDLAHFDSDWDPRLESLQMPLAGERIWPDLALTAEVWGPEYLYAGCFINKSPPESLCIRRV